MATVNLGSIKFKWKGTYAGGTAYTIDDVVSYNGSSYICIQASTGNLPTNTTYFDTMAQAGTNGTDGTDLTSTLTTQGDIVYRDASGLARLGAGTAGQVLQSGGTGANVSWTTISSGGLKQIVFAQTASSQAYSSSSYGDLNGVSVNITPSSSSNKVLIMSGIQYNLGSNDRGFQARIMRDSTAIQEPNNQKENYIAGTSAVHNGKSSYMFLDTPNTTSQITYKMQVFSDGANLVTFNNSSYSYIYAMEVAV